jgi:isopentenyl-diphosphate delta-isomerase
MYIDVLDEQGNRTGEALPREEIHKLGKIHRAIHLYLFDKSNNLLLQRRSHAVDHYPDMFSISVTGHVDAGEDSYEAVARELQEELGLDPNTVKLEFLFSLRQDAYISSSYIDRQFNDIYVCWADFKIEDISFDRKVVSEVKLVPFSELEPMINQKSAELAPVYKEECSKLVALLRDCLN